MHCIERTLRILPLILLILIVSGCRTSDQIDIAIWNVNVIDIQNNRVIPEATVEIFNGRIHAVRTGVDTTPHATEFIDATGMYVMPGLWDMHVHALWDSTAARDLLPLFIANGVTGIRDMGGIHSVRRYADSLIVSGDLISPRIFSPGPLLDGPMPIDPSISEAVSDSLRAISVVDSLAAAGVNFLKVYTLLPRDAFHGVVNAARTHDLQVVGHLPLELALSEAVEAGLGSLEHLNEGVEFICQPGSCDDVAMMLSDSAVYQTPTLSIIHAKANVAAGVVPDDERLQYMPSYLMDMWKAQANRTKMDQAARDERQARVEMALSIVGELHAAGVPILAGTDAGDLYALYGFSLPDELRLLTEAGLANHESLATATSNAAVYLDHADELGAVAPGMLADLIILRSNPLADVAAVKDIEAVIQGGSVYQRDDLDAILESRKR